jgi:hypothetical protein
MSRCQQLAFRRFLSRLIGPIGLIVVAILSGGQVAAKAKIELELVAEPGIPITGSQQWMAALKDLRLDRLRITGGREDESPELVSEGTAAAPVYRVKGVLTSRNQLRLPGATFQLSDKGRLADWLARLAEGGPEEVTSKRAAFGLTNKELVEVHQKLAVPVRQPTRTMRARDVIEAITRELALAIELDPHAAELIAGEHQVADELVGVASGTALAAVLRPLGLALVPKKADAGQLAVEMIRAEQVPESWPVGWPPEKKTVELVPKLLELLEVEIRDTPLSEAVDAIRGRLDIPFLVDHNALAKHRIDMAQVKVTYPLRRTSYKRILDSVLTQGRLRGELRVDEAGRAFIWISTVKP